MQDFHKSTSWVILIPASSLLFSSFTNIATRNSVGMKMHKEHKMLLALHVAKSYNATCICNMFFWNANYIISFLHEFRKRGKNGKKKRGKGKKENFKKRRQKQEPRLAHDVNSLLLNDICLFWPVIITAHNLQQKYPLPGVQLQLVGVQCALKVVSKEMGEAQQEKGNEYPWVNLTKAPSAHL